MVVELAVAGFEAVDLVVEDFEVVDFVAVLRDFVWGDLDRVELPLEELVLVE